MDTDGFGNGLWDWNFFIRLFFYGFAMLPVYLEILLNEYPFEKISKVRFLAFDVLFTTAYATLVYATYQASGTHIFPFLLYMPEW
jgi:hypothetical protein